MELKNKILVGGALCGALALNGKYAEQANEILRDENSSAAAREYAEGAKTTAEIAGLAIIGGMVVGLGGLLAKKKPGEFDLAANDDKGSKEIPFTVQKGDENGKLHQVYANQAAINKMRSGR